MNKPRRKVLHIIASAATVAVLIGVALPSIRRHFFPPQGAEPAVDLGLPPTQAPAGLSDKQTKGAAICATKVTVEFTSQDATETSGLSPAPVRYAEATQGSFTLTPVASDEQGWLAKVELSATSGTASAQPGAAAIRSLAERLNGQVLYVAFDPSGLLSTVYGAASANAAQRRDWDGAKMLLARWQFKTAADQSPAYDAAEADQVGLASVHYDKTSQSAVSKQKKVYIRPWGSGPHPEILASRIKAQVGGQGLERLEGDESYQIAVADFKTTVRSQWWQAVKTRTSVEPTTVGQCRARSTARAVKELGLVDLGMGPTLGSATTISQERHQFLEGRQVTVLVAELQSHQGHQSHQNGNDVLRANAPTVRDLIDRLTAWPQDADAVRDLVLKPTDNADLSRTLIGALASVATPEAQAALLAIMRAEQERGDRELWYFTMRSHVLTPAPGAKNIEYLLDLHRNEADKETTKVALLAASAAVSNLRSEDQSTYADQVLALRHSTGTERPELFAAALGNLASREAIPTLQAMVVGGSDALAMTALDALASIPGHDVDRLLLSLALTRSKSDTFRIRALSGLKPRALEEETVKDLIAFFQGSTDLDLKKAVLAVLLGESNRFWPVADAFVHQVANSPQTPDALRSTLKGSP